MKNLAVEAGSQHLCQAGTAGKGAEYLRSLFLVKTENDIQISDLFPDLFPKKGIFFELAQVGAMADSGNDSCEVPEGSSAAGKGLAQLCRP